VSPCCSIESDHSEDWEEHIKEHHEYEHCSGDELLEWIREAGVVGLGGGAFPTHVKLSIARAKAVETLIINGCESEPLLTADHRLMLEYSMSIIEGAHIVQSIIKAKALVFAIERNKKDAAELLKGEKVVVKQLRTMYPQGSEKQLVKVLMNREVPRGGMPVDVGCAVLNVATCHAILQAVKFRKPLIDRVVTVTGDVREPKNVLVRIGTPIRDVIDFCGGHEGTPKKILLGGPMMGRAQFSDTVPIVKGTTGIVVQDTIAYEHERACVRCSFCIDTCPMGLMPSELYAFIKHRRFGRARDYGLEECIECGCCDYVCPSRIPLVHYLKFGKSELLANSSL
jgi:electron transport complex protein RnfC